VRDVRAVPAGIPFIVFDVDHHAHLGSSRLPLRGEAAAVVESHVVSDRYQLWPPGQIIVPADMWRGLAMRPEIAATRTDVIQFGHRGSSISWCEFHPRTATSPSARSAPAATRSSPSHRCNAADAVAVRCRQRSRDLPLAAVLLCLTSSYSHVGRARTYNGDHSSSSHDSKSRRPISECASPRRYFRGREGQRSGRGRYRFEKCTEVVRKLAWLVRGAPIVSVTPRRYSRPQAVRA
jgi:hypothetical protein